MMPPIPAPPAIEQMCRYRGEILRMLLAAECLCPVRKGTGAECLPGCPFSAGGCEIYPARDLFGDSPPIGVCTHGEPVGLAIRCHSPDPCPHQETDNPTPCIVWCGREAEALAFLEQQEPEPLPEPMPERPAVDVMR
jgi:hypothetical protein